MKVLLFNIGRFAGAKAGTERVLCNMANALTQRGHEVEIVVYNNNLGEPPFPLDEKVKVSGIARGRLKLFERIRRSLFRNVTDRREYEAGILDARRAALLAPIITESKPDIIICHHAFAVRIVQALGKIDCPIVTMFHLNPKTVLEKSIDKTFRALAQCSRVQVLLESDIPVVKQYIGSDNIVCIPNAVPQFEDVRADFSSKLIVHVGRIDKGHKRQHLLIEAFAKAADYDKEWMVEFWGVPESRDVGYYEHCRNLVKQYGLQDRIKFCGESNKVIEEIRRGSIFCMPSATEGFGLALTEAMSVGLPAVGYKECPAVNELIVDGVNGILCEDGVEPLAEALLELMKDEAKRKQYGDNAKLSMKRYAPENIWDAWDELIQEAVDEYAQKKKQ